MLVQYADDLPFWHARVLLHPAPLEIAVKVLGSVANNETEHWWVLTPDGDVYPEPLSIGAIEGLVILPDSEVISAKLRDKHGRKLDQVYDFSEDKPAGRPSAITVCRALAAATAPVTRATGKVDPLGRGAPADAALVLPPAAAGAKWGVVAASGAAKKMEEVPVLDVVHAVETPFVLGTLGGEVLVLKQFADGEFDVVEAETEPLKAIADEEEVDARVLGVARTSDGMRHRDFRDAVAKLSQSDWDSWPINGPRTFLWCCRFIAEGDMHPRARHLRWKAAANISGSDAGVAEHEMIMRIVELALCYDQLQGSELASMEMLIRKAQLIELKHRDRVLAAAVGQVDDDAHLYLGTGQTRGLLMIDPELEEFVSAELSKEAATAKERRKMREERSLAKPPNSSQPGGGGKKQ